VGLARLEALACGTLFRDQATRARARSHYEAASSLSRHDALIPLEEAIFLRDTGDPPGARRAAERTLALEPEAVAPRVVLAEVALAEPGGAGRARRLLDEAEDLAARYRSWARSSRYAASLLGLDETRAADLRRRIGEAGR
jgi:predicted Zn-dependent protease